MVCRLFAQCYIYRTALQLISECLIESVNVDLCIDSFRLSGQGKTQSCLNEVVDHLHGTLQWLQFDKSIIAFTQSLDSPVLHIVGKCGSGKSVISKRLYKIMTLDRRGAIISIFFTFHASKAARQTLSDFLNFCILRIIETRKSMIHHVMPLWEEREQHVHDTSSWTEEQLLRILSILILENLEEHVVLVLDQLDQCRGVYNNVLRTLLQFFEDLQCRRHGCVQFVFSSQSSSLPVIPQQDYLLLDLDKAAGTQQDIEIYVRHQVRTKLEARYSDKLEQLIITELTRRADGMYIFVTPIVDLLSRNTDSSIKRVTDLIRSLPDNVSGLYRILWNNVMKQDRPRAARILAMTMHSTTPFLPTQLSEAIGVMQAEDEELGSPELLTEPENIVQDLVYLLGPFLRFEKTVDISHPSMKDFFTDPNRPPFEDESEYPELAQSDLAHALLGRICLRALVCRPFDRGLSFSLYAIHSFPKHIRLACESQTPELWHYLSSFFSTERRRNNGNAYNFFWRQFVRCQRTWGDVDVRDFTDDTQAFPMLGRLLRRQSSESDLERDVIVRHVTRMMGTQDPDDAMTDEPVFSARVSLNQSISFLCMNDVPHMLDHAARIRIASGEFTLKDLFCHVTESLQCHSLRCLDVLGDLFNLLQPVQLFDATRMLNDTYYKQDFVSGIPSTLVRPSHNSSGHDGHTKEVDQSSVSCFRPQIDSSLLPRGSYSGSLAQPFYTSVSQTDVVRAVRDRVESMQTIGQEDEVIPSAIVFFGLHLLRTNGPTACNLYRDKENLLDLIRNGKKLASFMLISALRDKSHVQAHDNQKRNMFHLAAAALDAGFLKLIIRSCHIDQDSRLDMLKSEDRKFLTPLHHACAAVKGGGTLDDTARRADRTATVKILMEGGALPITKIHDKPNSPLQLLCRTMEPDWVSALPDIVHDKKESDLLGTINLIWSDLHHFWSMDVQGAIPLSLACFNWPDHAVERLLKALPHGLDVGTIVDTDGRSPLHFAAIRPFTGTRKVMQLLLDAGFDPLLRDHTRHDPLFYAVKYGRPSSVKLLLRKRADIQIAAAYDLHNTMLAHKNSATAIEPVGFDDTQAGISGFRGKTPIRKTTFGTNTSYERLCDDNLVRKNMRSHKGDGRKLDGYDTFSNILSDNRQTWPVCKDAEILVLHQTLQSLSSWTVEKGLRKLQADFPQLSGPYNVAYIWHRRSEAAREIDSDGDDDDERCAKGFSETVPKPNRRHDPDIQITSWDEWIPVVQLRFRNQKMDRKIGRLIRHAGGAALSLTRSQSTTRLSGVDLRKEEDFLWLYGMSHEELRSMAVNDDVEHSRPDRDNSLYDTNHNNTDVRAMAGKMADRLMDAIRQRHLEDPAELRRRRLALMCTSLFFGSIFMGYLGSFLSWRDERKAERHPTCAWTWDGRTSMPTKTGNYYA